ncbi:hypothetical protein, partial [Janthinobacterium tructae]|uniref:hypothetical protein n=1 Tax=Janthinobacterium tructae TaxID=2590869 RepID=UPI00249BF801
LATNQGVVGSIPASRTSISSKEKTRKGDFPGFFSSSRQAGSGHAGGLGNCEISALRPLPFCKALL